MGGGVTVRRSCYRDLTMNAHTQSGGRQGRVKGQPYGDPVPSGQTYAMPDEPGTLGATGLLPADKANGITTRGAVARTSPEQTVTIPAAKVAASPSGGSQHTQHSRRLLTGPDAGYIAPYRQRGRKSKRGGKRGRKTKR